jgi:hypothetical protein
MPPSNPNCHPLNWNKCPEAGDGVETMMETMAKMEKGARARAKVELTDRENDAAAEKAWIRNSIVHMRNAARATRGRSIFTVIS